MTKAPIWTPENSVSVWWYSRQGLVYFFAAGCPPKAIKIGVTTLKTKDDWLACIRQRHESIQSSNHELVELLGVIRFTEGQFPGRQAEMRERELHKQFAALRRFKPGSRGSEWFEAAEDLTRFIREGIEQGEIQTPADLQLSTVVSKLKG